MSQPDTQLFGECHDASNHVAIIIVYLPITRISSDGTLTLHSTGLKPPMSLEALLDTFEPEVEDPEEGMDEVHFPNDG